MKQYLTEDLVKNIVKFKATLNNRTYTLSSHRVFSPEKIDFSTTKIMVHNENKEGQVFKLNQEYTGLYSIIYSDYKDEYNMKGWKFALTSSNVPCFSSKFSNLVKLKYVQDKEDRFLIQEVKTSQFLMIDTESVRDEFSFYISLTPMEEKATQFLLEKKKK